MKHPHLYDAYCELSQFFAEKFQGDTATKMDFRLAYFFSILASVASGNEGLAPALNVKEITRLLGEN